MIAIERFESRLQQAHECRIRDHVLALRDECRDHVASDEMKLKAKLQQNLQRDLHVVTMIARQIEAACDQCVQQFVHLLAL